jgi:hypothetical protein
MKKLLILTALTALTGISVGCNCCGRRAEYCPPYEQCDECGPSCPNCQPGGFGPAMGPAPAGAVITTPAQTYVPGPASATTRYLPR